MLFCVVFHKVIFVHTSLALIISATSKTDSKLLVSHPFSDHCCLFVCCSFPAPFISVPFSCYTRTGDALWPTVIVDKCRADYDLQHAYMHLTLDLKWLALIFYTHRMLIAGGKESLAVLVRRWILWSQTNDGCPILTASIMLSSFGFTRIQAARQHLLVRPGINQQSDNLSEWQNETPLMICAYVTSGFKLCCGRCWKGASILTAGCLTIKLFSPQFHCPVLVYLKEIQVAVYDPLNPRESRISR